MILGENLYFWKHPYRDYNLGGGFKYFLFSPRIPGEMIQFD